MTEKKVPVGKLIDKLVAMRETKRKISAQLDEAEDRYKALEAEIKERLGEEGLGGARGTLATASLSSTVVATVTDWNEVYALIHKKKAYHMLERRISNPAFRELYEQEYAKASKKKGFDPDNFDDATIVPGFKPFTKVNLNLTVLKK